MAHTITPVAIITGAGSGIGRAAALTLARSGLAVMLVGRRMEALEETASQLPEGVDSLCTSVDVSNPTSGQEIVSACVDRFGRLDVLVNNAAIAPLLDIEKTDAATIERVYMTNSVGPACAIAAAWPVFIKQCHDGRLGRLGHRVINVSTLGTSDPFAGFFAYAASKASLNVMAASCANEGKRFAVKAFSVAPGAVETPMLRNIFSKNVLPPSRCLSPQAVAEEIQACVMGERDNLNGQTIFLRAT
jgi:NAD(P)-dependent dehydrogenase (short-subunit alcohol dehydrogenase family)